MISCTPAAAHLPYQHSNLSTIAMCLGTGPPLLAWVWRRSLSVDPTDPLTILRLLPIVAPSLPALFDYHKYRTGGHKDPKKTNKINSSKEKSTMEIEKCFERCSKTESALAAHYDQKNSKLLRQSWELLQCSKAKDLENVQNFNVICLSK